MSAPTLTPLRRALLAIGARFRSGNNVPVEKALVPREEWEALCGALDAAPQPPAVGEPWPTWQPIETAPKDGTALLLWEEASIHPFVGWWAMGGWKVSHEHVDAEGGWDGAVVVDRLIMPITHWMPLPPDPGEAAQPADVAQTVAWARIHPDGSLAGDLLLDADIEDVRKRSGAWAPLARAQAAPAGVARLVDAPPGFIKPDNDRQVFFYEQDFYVLSNFSAFALQWSGLQFDTSEAAYHWEKFKGTECDDIRARIRLAPSAHEAFKIAEVNKHRRRSDWDDVKVSIMRGILRAKVQQHEYVRRKLLATGDRELIEDSWRDDFWGWGPNRDGQNMLGKLWMEVRNEIRAALAAKGDDHA